MVLNIDELRRIGFRKCTTKDKLEGYDYVCERNGIEFFLFQKQDSRADHVLLWVVLSERNNLKQFRIDKPILIYSMYELETIVKAFSRKITDLLKEIDNEKDN
jgi:hypothetical protein